MSNIIIKISQVSIENGNIQKIEPINEIEIGSQKAGKKSGIFELINNSTIAATLSGFAVLTVSETQYIIPVTENKHLINAGSCNGRFSYHLSCREKI
jgi:hypothetical protein